MFEIALPLVSVIQVNFVLYSAVGLQIHFTKLVNMDTDSQKSWKKTIISFSTLKYNVRNCLTAGIPYTGEFCPV